MSIDSVLLGQREETLRIAAKHGAGNVRVFGSAARGESGPASDIDLLVEFDPDRSLLDHVALLQDLEDLLGRKVDLVTEHSLHWYIRDQVKEEAIPL
jgi:predicted nucleotidyltransferase